jgi:hypothetical protein
MIFPDHEGTTVIPFWTLLALYLLIMGIFYRWDGCLDHPERRHFLD